MKILSGASYRNRKLLPNNNDFCLDNISIMITILFFLKRPYNLDYLKTHLRISLEFDDTISTLKKRLRATRQNLKTNVKPHSYESFLGVVVTTA